MTAIYRPYFSSALTLLTQPTFQSFYQIQSQTKFKTELCKNYSKGFCQYSNNCIFAHGQKELREKMFPEGQDKICRYYYDSGTCPYGVKCQFKHVPQTISGVTIIFEELGQENTQLLPPCNHIATQCLQHQYSNLTQSVLSQRDIYSDNSEKLNQKKIEGNLNKEREIKVEVDFALILDLKEQDLQQKEQQTQGQLSTQQPIVPLKFSSHSIWGSNQSKSKSQGNFVSISPKSSKSYAQKDNLISTEN